MRCHVVMQTLHDGGNAADAARTLATGYSPWGLPAARTRDRPCAPAPARSLSRLSFFGPRAVSRSGLDAPNLRVDDQLHHRFLALSKTPPSLDIDGLERPPLRRILHASDLRDGPLDCGRYLSLLLGWNPATDPVVHALGVVVQLPGKPHHDPLAITVARQLSEPRLDPPPRLVHFLFFVAHTRSVPSNWQQGVDATTHTVYIGRYGRRHRACRRGLRRPEEAL